MYVVAHIQISPVVSPSSVDCLPKADHFHAVAKSIASLAAGPACHVHPSWPSARLHLQYSLSVLRISTELLFAISSLTLGCGSGGVVWWESNGFWHKGNARAPNPRGLPCQKVRRSRNLLLLGSAGMALQFFSIGLKNIVLMKPGSGTTC